MKRQTVVAVALAMGIFSVGAVSASAANSCCSNGTCGNEQAMQKFSQEVAGTADSLKAKELELRELLSRDGFDTFRAGELSSEIDALKSKIKVAKDRHGLPSCCLG